MQGSPDSSLTPLRCSLCYDNNLVEIAARVVEEFRAEQRVAGSEFTDGDDAFSGMENDKTREAASKEEETKDVVKVEAEEDIEFAFAPTEMAFSPVSADEVFCNGQIRAIFPVHKRNLSTGEAEVLNRNSNSSTQPVKARLPLRKLFIQGRESPSSEAGKLDSDSDPGAEETYSVWEPKLGDDHLLSPGAGGGCTKSNSSTATDSSKWWKHLLSTPKRRCGFS